MNTRIYSIRVFWQQEKDNDFYVNVDCDDDDDDDCFVWGEGMEWGCFGYEYFVGFDKGWIVWMEILMSWREIKSCKRSCIVGNLIGVWL